MPAATTTIAAPTTSAVEVEIATDMPPSLSLSPPVAHDLTERLGLRPSGDPADLARLIGSIRIDGLGPVVDGRAASAAPAVATALAELDRRTRRSHVARPPHVTWYTCFPPEAAATATRAITLGPEGPLEQVRTALAG